MFGLLFRHVPPGSLRGRFASWWRAYVGSIAFVVLLLLAAIGFARIENARYEGCQGGNLLRTGLRTAEEEDIAQSAAIDRETLFPQISEEEFQALIAESRKRSYYRIDVLYAPRDCGMRISLPLTGAYITFPP